MRKNRIISTLFSRKNIFILFLLIIAILISLHFIFQFRTSDKKTLALFKKADVPVSIAYINSAVTNAKIRVILTGDRSDHTIIFVHGTPGSAAAFYDYLKNKSLLTHAQLITYDRPGYGYSSFGESFPSIKEQSLIIKEIIDTYKLKNVTVVGHSYGGPIAAYAAFYCDEIKNIIMLAPAIDPNAEKYFWIGNLAKWKLTRWMAPAAFRVAEDEKYFHVKALEAIKNEWKKVQVVTLIIHGKKDVLVPYENMNYVKTHFPSPLLKSITLPEENHFIPWTQDSLIIEQLLPLIETSSD